MKRYGSVIKVKSEKLEEYKLRMLSIQMCTQRFLDYILHGLAFLGLRRFEL